MQICKKKLKTNFRRFCLSGDFCFLQFGVNDLFNFLHFCLSPFSTFSQVIFSGTIQLYQRLEHIICGKSSNRALFFFSSFLLPHMMHIKHGLFTFYEKNSGQLHMNSTDQHCPLTFSITKHITINHCSPPGHCCICCNPADGRVDFDKWLAYKIQLHE